MTVGGPGLVAVGSDSPDNDSDAAVWTSSDGVSWSRVAHDEALFGGEGTQEMSSVTVGGPGLVAVGSDSPDNDSDAAVWTSSDGVSWSRVAHDEALFGGEGTQEMSSVTVGGPGLVAVGSDSPDNDSDAAVWTSSDGVSWSRVAHDEALFGGEGTQEMSSVTVGGPGLVAVGRDSPDNDSDAAVWTSSDGVSWSRVAHDEALFGGEGAQEMSSVTVGGPGLVAVGRDAPTQRMGAAVWTSSDGVGWSWVAHDEALFGGWKEMSSVTVGGPGLVAVGSDALGDSDAAVWTSPDGVSWSRVAHDEAVLGGPGPQLLSSVTVGGPGLVAVGSDWLDGDWDAALWTLRDG